MPKKKLEETEKSTLEVKSITSTIDHKCVCNKEVNDNTFEKNGKRFCSLACFNG